MTKYQEIIQDFNSIVKEKEMLTLKIDRKSKNIENTRFTPWVPLSILFGLLLDSVFNLMYCVFITVSLYFLISNLIKHKVYSINKELKKLNKKYLKQYNIVLSILNDDISKLKLISSDTEKLDLVLNLDDIEIIEHNSDYAEELLERFLYSDYVHYSIDKQDKKAIKHILKTIFKLEDRIYRYADNLKVSSILKVLSKSKEISDSLVIIDKIISLSEKYEDLEIKNQDVIIHEARKLIAELQKDLNDIHDNFKKSVEIDNKILIESDKKELENLIHVVKEDYLFDRIDK